MTIARRGDEPATDHGPGGSGSGSAADPHSGPRYEPGRGTDRDTTPGTAHMLGPATRMLWRSPGVVHFELGSAATIVEGLPDAVLQALAAPRRDQHAHPPERARPGRPARPAVADIAPPDPSTRHEVGHALTALAGAGYLWTRPHYDEVHVRDDRAAPPVPRLAGELTALATRHGERGAQVLAARADAMVTVSGTSRTAAHVAALLAAAGVGRITCAGETTARLHQAVPGGVTVGDEGTPFTLAVRRAVRAAAPEATVHGPLPDERADLTILAVDTTIAEERRQALHALDAPYLAVALGSDHGVVGPLVLPGLTSCLRCADLHRRDRDPAWSALAVQLAIGRRRGPSSDVTVATIVAGLAAQQALAFLDGGEPAVLDATVELRLPDWRLRRRSWPPHPDCDCAQPPNPHR